MASPLEDSDEHTLFETAPEVKNTNGIKSTIEDEMNSSMKTLSDIKLSSVNSLDAELECDDLKVTVDSPEKLVTNMESYTTFLVSTITTRSEYDSPEYSVRRRYNDFLWLRQRLESSSPIYLIPPLPEKHSLKRFDRFSPEFIKTREKALNKFMQRLSKHPVLSYSKFIQGFITLKPYEFTAFKKEGGGIFSRVSESIHTTSAVYMLKSRPPEYTMMYEYINTLGEKLGNLERISQRVYKEASDLAHSFDEWGPVFKLWSNSEEKLNQALSSIATATEKCNTALTEVVDGTDLQLTQPLKEYILYVDAVRDVLKRRDAIQAECQLTIEDSNRKKDEKEHVKISDQTYSLGAFLGRNPEEVKQEKQIKLQQQVEDLEKQVELMGDRLTCANADLKSEMDRWHMNKRRDFKEMFIEMADRQINYYDNCLAAWEAAIPQIQKTDSFEEGDGDE
ncbi:unnamed protein product [Owenia fusiformis]|nr:unnamed protein product [Owenia fusiformis]